MLVPLSVLEAYVKIKISPEKLAEKLLLSGTKVEEIKKFNGEIVFDLEITPNRADTLSFYGVAREIAAILNLDLNDPETDLLTTLRQPSGKADFKVADKKLCPFYSLVKLTNITIKDSPKWVQETLSLSGIRPLNNVIDITNLVMLELGQPMHAFDASKISGIPTVRGSKKGEKVVTLDNVERELPEGSIIIEDQEKLIDLAGLMGGKNSEIDQNTKDVFLLVPFYQPVAIRKTSLATGLRTEASNRFEKKLDPNMHPTALNRTVKLLVENAGASFASKITTVGFPVETQSLVFDTRLVKQILGIDLTSEDIVNLLSPLGFMISSQPLDEGKMTIHIPSHRPDVSLPEDILEEIGRIYGYNNFPKTLPSGELPTQTEVFQPDTEKEIRDYLIASGFSETTGYSLVSVEDLQKIKFDLNQALKVLHPTSSDFTHLRPSLLVNLLKAAETNNSREHISFFEIAKEFLPKINPATKLPKQEVALALVTTQTFGATKIIIEGLLSKFDFKPETAAIKEDDLWAFGTTYSEKGREAAKIGLINKAVLNNFDIKQAPIFAWIDFEYLLQKKLKVSYLPQPKFPSVIEDISFFVGEKNLAVKIVSFIKNFDSLIDEVEVFDAFEKGQELSLTVRINFRSPSRTLVSSEIEKLRLKLEKELMKKFKVNLRKE